MELNREQIVKVLECCASPKQVCGDCPMPQDVKDDCRCMEFISRNVLALIRKLTEENANLRFDVSSYKLERERNDSRSADLVAELAKEAETNLKLTEENAWLQAEITHLEGHREADIKAFKTLKADTVRKMVEIITANYAVSKVHYAKDEEPTITYQLTNWDLRVIAKELLE